jgi:hypothetical protein
MVQTLRPTPALHRYVLVLCVLACFAVGLSARKPGRAELRRQEAERAAERARDKRWASGTTRDEDSLLRRIHQLRD